MDVSELQPVPMRHECPSDRTPRRRIPIEPLQVPPPELLLRYRARLLDPVTAVTLPGQTVWPTVYLADRLLVRNYDQNIDLLFRAVDGIAQVETHRRLDAGPVSFVTLHPLATPAPAPDAWVVLQRFRTIADDAHLADVSLDHLMTACSIEGVPFIGSHGIGGVPFIGSHGVGEASTQYGVPGMGGRTPVAWLGPAPHRRTDRDMPCRRPVVAILDTGVGRHPWLTDDIVRRFALVDGKIVPTTDALGDPSSDDPWEGVLNADVGHGTFIAGLIRQMAPDASIMSVAIMPTSGAVPEGNLLMGLQDLIDRQLAAQAPGGDPADLIDVLSLSLGYYDESPEDLTYGSALLPLFEKLSELGVAVAASAGNDSTDRLMFPAAYTPYAGGAVARLDAARVPLMSVGALNPNRSAALFSNAGEWVACYRAGAAVVSCMPVDLDGGAQPSYKVTVPVYGERENIDPDNFAGGFASWSGTSFAAPILAGQMAQTMLDHHATLPLDALDRGSCVTRGWHACSIQTGTVRP